MILFIIHFDLNQIIWISATLRNKSNTKIQCPNKKQIINTNNFRNIYLIWSAIWIYIYIYVKNYIYIHIYICYELNLIYYVLKFRKLNNIYFCNKMLLLKKLIILKFYFIYGSNRIFFKILKHFGYPSHQISRWLKIESTRMLPSTHIFDLAPPLFTDTTLFSLYEKWLMSMPFLFQINLNIIFHVLFWTKVSFHIN